MTVQAVRHERRANDVLGSRTTRQKKKKRGWRMTSVRATSRMTTADPLSKDRREKKTTERRASCLPKEDADARHVGS